MATRRVGCDVIHNNISDLTNLNAGRVAELASADKLVSEAHCIIDAAYVANTLHVPSFGTFTGFQQIVAGDYARENIVLT